MNGRAKLKNIILIMGKNSISNFGSIGQGGISCPGISQTTLGLHMLTELNNVYKSANLYHIPMFASVWHSCLDHHYHHDHGAWDELSFSQSAEIKK